MMREAEEAEDDYEAGMRMLDDEYGEVGEPRGAFFCAQAPELLLGAPVVVAVVPPLTLSPAASATLVAVCAGLIASTGLLTRAAEVDGSVLYDASAACLFAELGKLAIALVLTAAGPHVEEGANGLSPDQERKAWVAFIPPAVGYVAVNTVRFRIVQLVNPGILQLMWNLKIVFIGFLYALPPFRRRFTARQWAGAAMLVVGTCAAERSQWDASDADGNSMTGGALGIAFVLVTLVITSASAIACEYAYKVVPMTLARQNLILYSYGVVLNFLTYFARVILRGDGVLDAARHLTADFSAWTWASVLAQSASGFAVGAVFKYVDSVAQVFADVGAMIVAAVAAHYLFDLSFNAEYVLALLTCASALVVFYSEGLSKTLCDQVPAAGVMLHRHTQKKKKEEKPPYTAVSPRNSADGDTQQPFWESRSKLALTGAAIDPTPASGEIELAARPSSHSAANDAATSSADAPAPASLIHNPLHHRRDTTTSPRSSSSKKSQYPANNAPPSAASSVMAS